MLASDDLNLFSKAIIHLNTAIILCVNRLFSLYLVRCMKRLLTILILFGYMLCASGLCISFHYCGGSFKYVSFTPDKEDKGCCGTKKKDRCCKDKVVKFNQNDHHKAVSSFSVHSQDISTAIVHSPVYIPNTRSYSDLAVTDFHLRPPPLTSAGPPLYILHSVFRI